MVAAEVRAQVETAIQREREKTEKAESRRDRLRDEYRRHIGKGGKAVDFGKVRNLVEGISEATYAAWRALAGARPYRACGGGDAGGLRRSRVPREQWSVRVERREEHRDAGAAARVVPNSRVTAAMPNETAVGLCFLCRVHP